MRSGIWPPNSSRPVLSYEKQLVFDSAAAAMLGFISAGSADASTRPCPALMSLSGESKICVAAIFWE
jgi:hypothetical protein